MILKQPFYYCTRVRLYYIQVKLFTSGYIDKLLVCHLSQVWQLKLTWSCRRRRPSPVAPVLILTDVMISLIGRSLLDVQTHRSRWRADAIKSMEEEILANHAESELSAAVGTWRRNTELSCLVTSRFYFAHCNVSPVTSHSPAQKFKRFIILFCVTSRISLQTSVV